MSLKTNLSKWIVFNQKKEKLLSKQPPFKESQKVHQLLSHAQQLLHPDFPGQSQTCHYPVVTTSFPDKAKPPQKYQL